MAPLLITTGLALIFDMDGVIIDSNPVHTQSWSQYLLRFGIQLDNLEARMYGRRNDEIVRDFFGAGLSEREVSAHGAAKEDLYRELMLPQIRRRLVPGVVQFIHSLPAVPLAVGTNAEPANVDFVLAHSGLAGLFRVIVNGHQVRHPKPHPEIYLKAAALLETPPADCVVFEDSLAGVEAARASGARVIGVKTSHTELPAVDFAIDDFTSPELVPWLSQQKPRP